MAARNSSSAYVRTFSRRSLSMLVMGAASSLLCVFTILPAKAEAQELTLGVVEIPRELNFLSAPKQLRGQRSGELGRNAFLASSLIRDAVSGTLVVLRNHEPIRISGDSSTHVDGGVGQIESRSSKRTPARAGSFDLSVGDSVQVSADQRQWSFRIRRGETFSSGQPVRAVDVLFSLKRCVADGGVQSLFGFEGRVVEALPGSMEEWVDVRTTDVAPRPSDLLALVAACPILEEQSSSLFGPRLGEGANIVSVGAFRIADFEAGREVILEQSQAGEAFAKRIVLRALRDGTHALTALRTGTVDAIFFENSEVLSRAASDQTLLTIECSGYKVVHRRGLNVECRQSVVPTFGAPTLAMGTSGSTVAARVAEAGSVEAAGDAAIVQGGSTAFGSTEFGSTVFGSREMESLMTSLAPAPIDLRRLRYLS